MKIHLFIAAAIFAILGAARDRKFPRAHLVQRDDVTPNKNILEIRAELQANPCNGCYEWFDGCLQTFCQDDHSRCGEMCAKETCRRDECLTDFCCKPKPAEDVKAPSEVIKAAPVTPKVEARQEDDLCDRCTAHWTDCTTSPHCYLWGPFCNINCQQSTCIKMLECFGQCGFHCTSGWEAAPATAIDAAPTAATVGARATHELESRQEVANKIESRDDLCDRCTEHWKKCMSKFWCWFYDCHIPCQIQACDEMNECKGQCGFHCDKD